MARNRPYKIKKELIERILALQQPHKRKRINDELLVKGIIRGLEIIGEAIKRLTIEFKSKYPEVHCEEMAGMQDVLIHHYFGIDYDVTWATVTRHIPESHHEIQKIVQ
jgi:uncharacterized protein with HEPN domain